MTVIFLLRVCYRTKVLLKFYSRNCSSLLLLFIGVLYKYRSVSGR